MRTAPSVVLNERVDRLVDYPFSRLRTLLAGVSPPPGVTPRVLSIGEPQEAPQLVARTIEAHRDDWWRYPSLDGTEAFRGAVQGWCVRRFGVSPDLLSGPRTVLPVAGTREALFLLALTVVPPEIDGQRPVVLLPNPYYAGYPGAAIMAGAEPHFVSGPGPRSLPDLSGVDPGVLDRVALAYVCSPSNPQGEAATLAYLVRMIRLARQHGFVLAVDECAIDLYHGEPPPGALQACAELGEGLRNVVVFESLSKRSSAAGLRSGAVIGDPAILQRLWEVRCFGGATVPVPILSASAALWNDDAHVVENRARVLARIDAAGRILGRRFDFYRPDAGFFLWLNVGDGESAARLLWERAALQVMPGAYLARDAGSGNPGAPYIRVALVHDLATVEEALRRLVEVL